jgi:hypothetical protein
MSRAIVATTASVGGDTGKVARDTVDEAIAAARDLGLDAGDAAKAATTGALRGAEEIGETAVHTVTDTLSAMVNGVRVVIRGREVEARSEQS